MIIPPDILDDVFVKFFADRVDQDIDRIAFRFLAPAVEPLLDLFARQDSAGSVHQSSHQREFASGKQDVVASEGHFMSLHI